MYPILHDLNNESLVAAIKLNFYDSFRRLQHADQSEYILGSGFERWHTTVPHPLFNGVLVTRYPDEDDVQLIQNTLEYFNYRKIPAHSWWLEPTIYLEAWRDKLEAAGYQYAQGAPGMAIDLDRLPKGGSQPDRLQVQEVHDKMAFENWSHVFIEGYALPDPVADSLLSLYRSMGFELPSRYYLGILDGKPVATSRLFLGGGAAGIYNVSTLPDYRGQGIGSVLTLLPLEQAHSMGYRAGILQSTEMGFRLYQRLGFKKLCDMEHFIWGAGEAD